MMMLSLSLSLLWIWSCDYGTYPVKDAGSTDDTDEDEPIDSGSPDPQPPPDVSIESLTTNFRCLDMPANRRFHAASWFHLRFPWRTSSIEMTSDTDTQPVVTERFVERGIVIVGGLAGADPIASRGPLDTALGDVWLFDLTNLDGGHCPWVKLGEVGPTWGGSLVFDAPAEEFHLTRGHTVVGPPGSPSGIGDTVTSSDVLTLTLAAGGTLSVSGQPSLPLLEATIPVRGDPRCDPDDNTTWVHGECSLPEVIGGDVVNHLGLAGTWTPCEEALTEQEVVDAIYAGQQQGCIMGSAWLGWVAATDTKARCRTADPACITVDDPQGELPGRAYASAASVDGVDVIVGGVSGCDDDHFGSATCDPWRALEHPEATPFSFHAGTTTLIATHEILRRSGAGTFSRVDPPAALIRPNDRPSGGGTWGMWGAGAAVLGWRWNATARAWEEDGPPHVAVVGGSHGTALHPWWTHELSDPHEEYCWCSDGPVTNWLSGWSGVYPIPTPPCTAFGAPMECQQGPVFGDSRWFNGTGPHGGLYDASQALRYWRIDTEEWWTGPVHPPTLHPAVTSIGPEVTWAVGGMGPGGPTGLVRRSARGEVTFDVGTLPTAVVGATASFDPVTRFGYVIGGAVGPTLDVWRLGPGGEPDQNVMAEIAVVGTTTIDLSLNPGGAGGLFHTHQRSEVAMRCMPPTETKPPFLLPQPAEVERDCLLDTVEVTLSNVAGEETLGEVPASIRIWPLRSGPPAPDVTDWPAPLIVVETVDATNRIRAKLRLPFVVKEGERLLFDAEMKVHHLSPASPAVTTARSFEVISSSLEASYELHTPVLISNPAKPAISTTDHVSEAGWLSNPGVVVNVDLGPDWFVVAPGTPQPALQPGQRTSPSSFGAPPGPGLDQYSLQIHPSQVVHYAGNVVLTGDQRLHLVVADDPVISNDASAWLAGSAISDATGLLSLTGNLQAGDHWHTVFEVVPNLMTGDEYDSEPLSRGWGLAFLPLWVPNQNGTLQLKNPWSPLSIAAPHEMAHDVLNTRLRFLDERTSTHEGWLVEPIIRMSHWMSKPSQLPHAGNPERALMTFIELGKLAEPSTADMPTCIPEAMYSDPFSPNRINTLDFFAAGTIVNQFRGLHAIHEQLPEPQASTHFWQQLYTRLQEAAATERIVTLQWLADELDDLAGVPGLYRQYNPIPAAGQPAQCPGFPLLALSEVALTAAPGDPNVPTDSDTASSPTPWVRLSIRQTQQGLGYSLFSHVAYGLSCTDGQGNAVLDHCQSNLLGSGGGILQPRLLLGPSAAVQAPVKAGVPLPDLVYTNLVQWDGHYPGVVGQYSPPWYTRQAWCLFPSADPAVAAECAVDQDQDGAPMVSDCDDMDAVIRPGADDIIQPDVDENCNCYAHGGILTPTAPPVHNGFRASPSNGSRGSCIEEVP